MTGIGIILIIVVGLILLMIMPDESESIAGLTDEEWERARRYLKGEDL